MKRFFCAVILASSCFGAYAQSSSDSTAVELEGTIVVNPFNKNWEVNLAAGAQAYVGEHSDTYFDFKDWWCPTVDLAIKKWVTPCFAFGFGFNMSGYKGLYHPGIDNKAVFQGADDPIYKDKLKLASGSYANPSVDISLDLCNLFGGYKSGRVFHVIAEAGGGAIFPVNKTRYYNSLAATFNAGLRAHLYFGKHWGAYLNIRGALVGDDFNGLSYTSSNDRTNIPLDGIIGCVLGLSYKFGFVNKSNAGTASASAAAVTGKEAMEWVPMTVAMKNTETYKTDIATAETNAVKGVEKKVEAANKLAEARGREIQVLEAKTQAYEAQLAVNSAPFTYRQYVNFKIDKYNISQREKVAIQLAAEVIKANPSYKFSVVGFADRQTAYPAYNRQLSRNRAEAVAECLVKEFGVSADSLVVSYDGGVDCMFYDSASLSRAVLITVIQK